MHQSENPVRLQVKKTIGSLAEVNPTFEAVEFVILPYYESTEAIPEKEKLYAELNSFIQRTNDQTTIAVLTSPIFANDFIAHFHNSVNLRLWISVKLEKPVFHEHFLAEQHCALLVFTRYAESLHHTKTRIGYSYCPFCEKTTKDYGGKKHLYHEFGTLMSDVWRDITVDFENYPDDVILRLADLFGIPHYKTLSVHDQRNYYKPISKKHIYKKFPQSEKINTAESMLLNGDCIEELKKVPDNSIDFCFADPPYNLNKKYESWDDSIDIKDYFNWCDQWLTELARVLKPGHSLAVLNIPQWSIRHFKHLTTILDFQDWIVWEGLSLPVRMIMPSHYSILCFSKGKPRALPAMERKSNSFLEKKAVLTFKEEYCSRSNCISKRQLLKVNDCQFVSNVWFDVHRLKHNSRRVDHPCQLPPLFMYRLISLFTHKNEIVLDPFNGAGTTTLTAQQLNRNYVGIELSEYYHNIAAARHRELSIGLDPFRKTSDDKPKAKNSRVERLKKQKYEVSKKVLQLEIKNISKKLGHIPSIEEVEKYSKFPIEYYENYFINWGEVTAAARTTGMTEKKQLSDSTIKKSGIQLPLFEDVKSEHEVVTDAEFVIN